MYRRSLLKLLGGAIAAGVLPKPPLLVREPVETIFSQTPTNAIFGWSDSLKRFVTIDEIKYCAPRLRLDESDPRHIAITNLGPIITKGLIKIPVIWDGNWRG